MRIADCPICGDIGGFHHDDCGSSVIVDRSLILVTTVNLSVKLTQEEIQWRRAEAAQRKQEKERTG